HEQVVKLLLNQGANVNGYCGEYGNTLQTASDSGHDAVVKLVLNEGVNTNT
ncbi:hypothetical protein BKA66DRAFT_409990, partial [Pyrenochaeta sp. MPI-SDFR-AT-0127]